MKKNEFKIFTKNEYKFIPSNVILIKEKNGWVFMFVKDTKWYTNSTNDSANCTEEENEKVMKKLIKALKPQIASV